MEKELKIIHFMLCIITVVGVFFGVSNNVFASEIDSSSQPKTKLTEEFYLDENQKVIVSHERKTDISNINMLKSNSETLYRTQDITTFSISEFEKGKNTKTGSGTVYITLFYSIDSSTNAYKLKKITFKYDIDSSRYRFVNVQGGYQANGRNVSNGSLYTTNGYRMKTFSDKIAGTSTETLTVNSPFLKYSDILWDFGMSGITTCKLKDMITGTTSNTIRLECVI